MVREVTSLLALVSVTEPLVVVTASAPPVMEPVCVTAPAAMSVIGLPWMPAAPMSKPLMSE